VYSTAKKKRLIEKSRGTIFDCSAYKVCSIPLCMTILFLTLVSEPGYYSRGLQVSVYFNCETKWWCCVYKIKTKKKKEGENPWQAVAVLPLEDECAMAFGDGLQW
jgi:hypothetical protein